jgi:cytochrome P450
MDEEHIVAQLRTIISAGYETISATIAVRFIRAATSSLVL